MCSKLSIDHEKEMKKKTNENNSSSTFRSPIKCSMTNQTSTRYQQ